MIWNLDPTFLGVTFFVATKYVMLNKVGRTNREKKFVARISRITLFPVKSMKGVDVQEAECTHTGLTAQGFTDRCFMVTNSKYEFISARKISQLAAIKARIDEGELHLSSLIAPSISLPIPSPKTGRIITGTVWEEEVECIDCGDEVAVWLDTALEKNGLRLVYHTEKMQKRPCDTLDTPWHQQSKPQDQVSFQDGFPYMLLSENSVHELNSRIPEPVHINNFRPNIVVEGCDEYAEDKWDKIYIGECEFFNIKPCHRCIMTTVNPESGKRDSRMEPLRTLKKYRCLPENAPQFWIEHPTFGINLVAIQTGILRVGDPVYATKKHNRF